MTEPRNPRDSNPASIDRFDLMTKRAVLAEALGAFSATVLANDTLSRAIIAKLQGDGSIATNRHDDLKDFRITPNIKDNRYSLCLEESARGELGDIESDGGAVGSMSFKFSTLKYVPLCAIETDDEGKRGVAVSRRFADLALGRDVLSEIPTDEETAAIGTAVRTVLGAIEAMSGYCHERGVALVSDGYGRPQLLEDAQNTFYVSE